MVLFWGDFQPLCTNVVCSATTKIKIDHEISRQRNSQNQWENSTTSGKEVNRQTEDIICDNVTYITNCCISTARGSNDDRYKGKTRNELNPDMIHQRNYSFISRIRNVFILRKSRITCRFLTNFDFLSAIIASRFYISK